MKKTILKTLAALSFVALVIYNVKSGSAETLSGALSLSSLGKQALADCESTTGLPGDWIVTYHSACSWTCTHGGTNTCPL
ncbi:hypothetical protein [Desertivirga xinjiangensis]|uniref:hypothetical protein n=1 Tax=Desertivirga xinjiangensis TaxID=539206 RepID=UPI002108E3CC|nr:hypothetical protein [Pedobacter xinjiangensis]